jgi:ribosomal protein S27AE
MPKTGEKPGTGTYLCKNCNHSIYLDDDSDRLPPCPKCTKTDFIKI